MITTLLFAGYCIAIAVCAAVALLAWISTLTGYLAPDLYNPEDRVTEAIVAVIFTAVTIVGWLGRHTAYNLAF